MMPEEALTSPVSKSVRWAAQIAEMRSDGGGAKVDRQPEKPTLMQAGPDIQDLKFF